MITADKKPHTFLRISSVHGKSVIKIAFNIRKRNDKSRRIPNGLRKLCGIALIDTSIGEIPFVAQAINGKSADPTSQKNRQKNTERNKKYNQTMDLIETLEDEGRIIVIRPQLPVEVGRMEKNIAKLTALYEEGYRVAKGLVSENQI